MIHQFNAMVRRLRALIEEYEERVHSAGKKPEEYLAALIKNEMEPEEVRRASREFFADHYTILGFWIEKRGQGDTDLDLSSRVESCCERNPRYASRCITYMEKPCFFSCILPDHGRRLYEPGDGHGQRASKNGVKRAGYSHMGVRGKRGVRPGSFYRTGRRNTKKRYASGICTETMQS